MSGACEILSDGTIYLVPWDSRRVANPCTAPEVDEWAGELTLAEQHRRAAQRAACRPAAGVHTRATGTSGRLI